MCAAPTDDAMTETDRYTLAIREHLRGQGEVASKDVLRAKTDVPSWFIDQIATADYFYTSLTHNGSYVASKYIVGRRSDHNGFWRPDIPTDERVVFHRHESTKATVKHLVYNRPSGLTPAEATDLLGRPCYKALQTLVDDGTICRVELDVPNTVVYVHHWSSIRESQLTQRRTDQEIDLGDTDEPADEYLFIEELLRVFMAAAEESIESAPIERVAACLLRQFKGDSFDRLATRLQRNHTLQDVLGYERPEDVDDASTLWRAFDALTGEELKDCLHTLTSEVLEQSDNPAAGTLLVVDGTHVEAWANTRDTIENGDVEGAAWGHHEGKFYGYQLMLLVDPAIELPVGILVKPGNEAEKTLLAPLIEDFEERYDTDEFDCEVMFADAEYDTSNCREEVQELLDAPLVSGINPRRSQPLKALKQEIKGLFKEHGDEIETPYDALELLPQQQLSAYGVEVGSVEGSYIYRAIKERMNRHLRSAVERVIGRLKDLTGLTEVRARKKSSSRTHLHLSGVALATVAVTAHRVGKPSLMRSPARVVL